MKFPAQNPFLWVIATLCIALVPQLASMPVHLVPLTLLPVAWRIAGEIRGWKPAPMLFRVGATVLSLYILLQTYDSLMGRRAAVSMLALMLTLKLLETFKVRDGRVVVSFSLFLCATQFLFLQTVPMIVYGGLCIIASLVALALLSRKDSFQPVGPAPNASSGLLGELGFSARMMAIAIPFGLALFFLFPRWGSPLWGVPEEVLDAKSGLSDTMSPGTIQGLFMDDTPAFRVVFESESPPQNELYWRGPVFWNFDGRSWTGSWLNRNVPAEDKPDISTAPWRYTIQLEPNERHWLFALDYPAVVPRGAKLTMDYQLYARKPVTQLKEYVMLSNPDFTDSAVLRSTFRGEALALPPGFNPRTQAMMDQWREESMDNGALVRRALNHFRQEEFRYTLNPELLSRHTVDAFLFDTREGFCEHYASAFTIMMRMAGIPSRVVTGYQGGWYNDVGGYTLVRQSDAHAWSEVWLQDTGWIRIDPTAAVAPDRIEQNALDALGDRRHAFDFTWVRTLRNGFDLLGRLWNEGVIAFDATRQAGLLDLLGLNKLGKSGLVVVLVAVLGLLFAVMAPLVLRMRARGRHDAAGKLWLKFKQQLRAQGVDTPVSQGPMELADHACQQLAGRDAEIRTFTNLYLRLRYAQEPPELKELQQALRGFSAAT